MKSNARRTWIAGTAFIAVLVLLATWFLLISPKRTEVADIDEQATSISASNKALEVKVAELRAQFARIDEFKDALAALRVKMPIDADMTELLTQFDTLAEKSDVDLAQILGANGEQVVLLTGAKKKALDDASAVLDGKKKDGADKDKAAAEKDKAAADKEPSDKESTAPAAKAETEGEILVAFPMTLSVYGTYADVRGFMESLQEKFDRHVLVTGLEATSYEEGAVLPDATRELKDGDVEYLIKTQVYVYTNKDAKFDKDFMVGTEEEAKLPKPGKDANPFRRDQDTSSD